MKKRIKFLGLFIVLLFFLSSCKNNRDQTVETPTIKIAVEFVDHAASLHIAKYKNWFNENNIKIKSFDNYITGMALSSALIHGDIDAAYICLIPAINAYANGKVPIKIVAGTHKYGYGLVVNPNKFKNIKDLEKIKFGCPREGSPNDILLNKLIEKYNLDKHKVKKNIVRMPPPKILMSLKNHKLEAGFMCEQFPTMAEEFGFKEIINAKDIWTDMQGSVLVVRKELIEKHPDIVYKLVKITQRGINFINTNPDESSKIVSEALGVSKQIVLPMKISNITKGLNIKPEYIKKSLQTKMVNTIDLDKEQIQKTIDYLNNLGYIKTKFPADKILDLQFINKLKYNETK